MYINAAGAIVSFVSLSDDVGRMSKHATRDSTFIRRRKRQRRCKAGLSVCSVLWVNNITKLAIYIESRSMHVSLRSFRELLTLIYLSFLVYALRTPALVKQAGLSTIGIWTSERKTTSDKKTIRHILYTVYCTRHTKYIACDFSLVTRFTLLRDSLSYDFVFYIYVTKAHDSEFVIEVESKS